MLDPARLLADPDGARRALGRRGEAARAALKPFFVLEARRRDLIRRTDELRAERNRANEGMKSADKTAQAFAEARERLRAVSNQIKQLETRLREAEERRDEVLLRVPNWPADAVPDGADGEANVEVARWGEPPRLDFAPRAHWELGERLGILDFERAAKVSGARFAFLRGMGARLERALIQMMMDLHGGRGYVELWPPFLVKPEAMVGTGQLPNLAADAFRTEGGELYLVPTAEVPVTNYHREEILPVEALPLRYVAYSPCFRAEAGSHGQDVRGLIRQHQFDKVELVKFSRPETSYDELESLRADAEEVLRRLGLHYRVMALCAGDLGFASARTYDLEVWLPGQDAFREISSCSNFEDYQARRARIRFKEGTGKPRLAHTLNGSAMAIGRTMVAILEQCQRRDGSVVVPEALRPYLGVEAIGPV